MIGDDETGLGPYTGEPLDSDRDEPWDHPFSVGDLADAIRAQMPPGFTVEPPAFDCDGTPYIRVIDPDGFGGGSGVTAESMIGGAEDVVSEHTTDPFTLHFDPEEFPGIGD